MRRRTTLTAAAAAAAVLALTLVAASPAMAATGEKHCTGTRTAVASGTTGYATLLAWTQHGTSNTVQQTIPVGAFIKYSPFQWATWNAYSPDLVISVTCG